MITGRMQPFAQFLSRSSVWLLGLGWGTLAVGAAASAESARPNTRPLLIIDEVPPHGWVAARVDLTAAAGERTGVKVLPAPGSGVLGAQFVPDEVNAAIGMLIVRGEPGRAQVEIPLEFSAPASSNTGPKSPARSATAPNRTTVRTRWCSVTHDAGRQGGLPVGIRFTETGMTLDSLTWNDRLYHRERGQFWLRHDGQPQVECISAGPLCTVVRVATGYARPDGGRPASEPAAVYDWYYFHDQPWAYVQGRVQQREAQPWHEAHFLELVVPASQFSRWAGGRPRTAGGFTGNDQSHRFDRWGAVIAERDAIGMWGAGTVAFYDGREYGPYLHADVDAAWQAWTTTGFERAAWLWLGSDTDPAATIAREAEATGQPQIHVSTQQLRQRIRNLQAEMETTQGEARRTRGWSLALARLLEKHRMLREALELPPDQVPEHWTTADAGDLRVVFERRADGLALLDLVDLGAGALLGGGEAQALFGLTLRHSETGQEIRLSSEQGWGEVTCIATPGDPPGGQTWRWQQPRQAELGGFAVTAVMQPDPVRHRVTWSLHAEGQSGPWSLWRVRFPQLVLAATGAEAQLLLPQAAGVLKPVGREPLARFQGEYPSGWLTMQLAAVYDPTSGTGMYLGLHDPAGSTKDLVAENAGGPRSVRLGWDIPVPDMGQPGNQFQLSGSAVWQLLRGDWFDAAIIYRDWARREARWYPRLGVAGREDTPTWMRDVRAWALTGGAAEHCVPRVRQFAEALGTPIGFHWYNWHQIPFDNDYPHYFPTQNGFTEGVRQLQSAGVRVMPYINGRLWDTRDRGSEDYEFTRLARPAATKDRSGEPYVETYGSQETNGEPVRLAVMCPATPLWRERQSNIVRRLFHECGVKAVYIDQVAAAKPQLCFDPTHGHPLGGGSWWNDQGYWPLLESLRQSVPPDGILTTECNAETFLRWFDGYLTWHWQYDGQVPLFPAVYGGAIQMFGRAYRGGETKDLALRMKAAQQLVWGEQLGWLDPNLVNETNNFPFFRDAVRLRAPLRRFFNAGQMARPPKPVGNLPQVTADWQWSGPWPVTTAAVLSGAWHLPQENRLVLLFANVAEQPIAVQVHYDLQDAGLRGTRFSRRLWTPDGEQAAAAVGPVLRESVTFPPRSLCAWEFGQQ